MPINDWEHWLAKEGQRVRVSSGRENHKSETLISPQLTQGGNFETGKIACWRQRRFRITQKPICGIMERKERKCGWKLYCLMDNRSLGVLYLCTKVAETSGPILGCFMFTSERRDIGRAITRRDKWWKSHPTIYKLPFDPSLWIVLCRIWQL